MYRIFISHASAEFGETKARKDLTVVKVGDAEQTLTTFIGQRLAEKFHLTVSPGMTISICLVEPPPLPSKQKEVWR